MRRLPLLPLALLAGCSLPYARPPAFVPGSAGTMEKVFRDEAWTRGPVEKLAIEA